MQTIFFEKISILTVVVYLMFLLSGCNETPSNSESNFDLSIIEKQLDRFDIYFDESALIFADDQDEEANGLVQRIIDDPTLTTEFTEYDWMTYLEYLAYYSRMHKGVGEFSKAQEYSDLGLAQSTKVFGKNSSLNAKFHLEKARLEGAIGNYDYALEESDRALWLIRNRNKEIDKNTYKFLLANAELLHLSNRIDKSLEVHIQVYNAWREEFNSYDYSELLVASTIATLYLKLGKTEKAKEYYESVRTAEHVENQLTEFQLSYILAIYASLFPDDDKDAEKREEIYSEYFARHDSMFSNDVYLDETNYRSYVQAISVMVEVNRDNVRYEYAREFLKRKEQIEERMRGKDSVEVANVLEEHGQLLQIFGYFDQSRMYFERSSAIYDQLAPKLIDEIDLSKFDEHSKAIFRYPLNMILSGKRKEGIEALDKILNSLRDKPSTKPWIEIVSPLLEAPIQHYIGDYEKALINYRNSFEIAELGGDKTLSIKMELGMADVIAKLGDTEKALELISKLEAKLKNSSIDHKALSSLYRQTLETRSVIHAKQGDFELAEANKLLQYGISIQKANVSSRQNIARLNDISQFYRNTGILSHDRKIKLFESSFNAMSNLGIERGLQGIRVTRLLSDEYNQIGDHAIAEEWLERSYDSLMSVPDYTKSNFVDEVILTSRSLIEQQMQGMASELVKSIEPYIESEFAENHSQRYEIEWLKGELLVSRAQYDAASSHVRKVHDFALKLISDNKISMVTHLQRMSRFYFSVGDIDQYVDTLQLLLDSRSSMPFSDYDRNSFQSNVGQVASARYGLFMQNSKLKDENTQSLKQLAESFAFAQNQNVSRSATLLKINALQEEHSEGVIAKLIDEWKSVRLEHISKRDKILKGILNVEKTNSADQIVQAAREILTLAERKNRLISEITNILSVGENTSFAKVFELEEVGSVLDDDEVLVMLVSTRDSYQMDGRTYIWQVSNSESQLRELPLSTQELQDYMERLRCGLDVSAWSESDSRCSSIFPEIAGKNVVPDMNSLPFDSKLANNLYGLLFSTLSSEVNNIYFVPNGPLSQLPLNVLVADMSLDGNMDENKYFVDMFSHGVYPSISTFMADKNRENNVTKKVVTYVGVGNPLLEGNQNHPIIGSVAVAAAERAKNISQCSGVEQDMPLLSRLFGGSISHEGLRSSELDVADRTVLLGLPPLPETAEEVCSVSETVGANSSSVLLGKNSSEKKVRELIRSLENNTVDVMHFASHAIMSKVGDQLSTGIVLTPPSKNGSNSENDGFLSAYEISKLNLNAEWVILSACNTGNSTLAENELYGGIAEAFVYTNVKSLLVSNWSVASSAAVSITTRLMDNYYTKGTQKMGALREAIQFVKSSDTSQHPAYWGAFSLVATSNI